VKILDLVKCSLYRKPESPVEKEFMRLRKELESGPRFCKKTIHFLDYNFDIVDNLSFIWQFRDIFVDEIYRFDGPYEDPLIYDCGANVGTSCLYFKSIFPQARIKAFEADPAVCDVLERNIIKNGLNDIEVIRKAVWIHNETIEFGCQGADAGSIYRTTGVREIEAARLRDFILDEERVALLKLDIEGAEADVVIDCADVLNRVDFLFVEYHSYSNRPQRLNEILTVITDSALRYFISPVSSQKSPFIQVITEETDLHVNIFAYRKR
jgi:FkbM family methyltransferase